MIYLDYVSTTPLNQEVNHMYQSLLNDYFANADSLYSLGLKTSALMEKSRELTARMLGVLPEEIIFTSGASESNSTAIKGCAFQYQNRGKHILKDVLFNIKTEENISLQQLLNIPVCISRVYN